MADARIPPHSIEAERAVLAALLTGDNVYDNISGIITEQDFYRDAHRIVFGAIQNIIYANKRADLVLLTDELTRLKKLDEVGGIAYITSLTNDSLATYNAEEHARIVAEKAQLRRLIAAGEQIVGISYEGADTAEDIVNRAEQLVLGVSGQIKADTGFSSIGQVMEEVVNRVGELAQNTDAISGVPTGFIDLDKLTNGLQPSDLILVAARPSMGKTAFTLNIASNVALESKKSVAFFSLEMSKAQLVGRILSSVAQVSSEKLRRGQLEPDDWNRIAKAAEMMGSARLYIDDTADMTPQDMRSRLRRLKVDHGLDLIIIDYIQLMKGRSGSKSSPENRQQEISEISRNLKIMAREFNVPLIALSQLSRAVEARQDKRPLLSDLRESGSLEQDADIVAFLYRDKYYTKDENAQDVTEVIISKHRNGALDNIKLLFDGALTKFRNTTSRPDEV
ncbi:replicative DNA helicase [uncultured Veillonella sp.]|uniref:replicative DNA helicase n=1 Tax=uncultured Veillonella sp. TaxID=159268 RepID=UPI002600219B|nr:replicative DNA helicase [uncultured Veillonella sp.]MDY3973742.1 replicative DNA helicase [Veillonella caviae]